MPETDAFDPTHALDGWRPPAPASVQELDLDALLHPDRAKAQPLLAGTAGFDPTRLLDGWRPPAPAPLDLDLKAMLRVGAMPDEAKMARLKARGYEMLDVEDVELVAARPPAPPPAEADFAPAALKEEAVDLPLPEEVSWPPFVAEAQVLDAEAQPAFEPEPTAVEAVEEPAGSTDVEAPVLDLHVAPPSPIVAVPELDTAVLAPQPDPRLLAHWQAGAWAARVRRVAGASEELLQTPEGLRVESHASQWLCAIWPPQAEDVPLGRWPELAAIVSAESDLDALRQLLVDLPDEAPLWSTDLEADWDLVAELVLHQDAGLRPAQAQALRELVEAERRLRLARLGEGYVLQGRLARRRA